MTLILKLPEQIQIGFLSPWDRGENREKSQCSGKKTENTMCGDQKQTAKRLRSRADETPCL